MKNVEDWKTDYLACIAKITMGQSPDSRYYSEEENGLPFLQGCAEFGSRFPNHFFYCSQTKKVANADSILFSVRAPVGRINIADRDYIIGRGLAAILAEDVDQTYLEHYLRHEESKFSNASQGSTFEAINSTELSKWPIGYPTSRHEQRKIAEVISTVDRAIEQTEALITKQQRIKTGLMQDLLTRGIDEHGNLRSEKTHKFKNSPLGRIPTEWTSCQIGNAATLQRGHDITEDDLRDGPYPVISSSGVIGYHAERTSKGPNVVVGRKGTIGRVHYLEHDFWAHDTSLYVTNFRGNDEHYIFYLFNHLDLARYGTKSGSPSLNRNDIHPLWIGLPSPDEQGKIATILKRYDQGLDSLGRGSGKLRAFKTALMQDLLTGNRRVTVLTVDTKREREAHRWPYSMIGVKAVEKKLNRSVCGNSRKSTKGVMP